jgi:predicted type IV restriction endonuclease
MEIVPVTIPQKVLDLIEVFARNAEDYLSSYFNEAMLRQQFINPLFKCLGWDMDNEQGYAEAYKDVIHEAAIKIGGATKAPDYCFRVGGTPKFYLEAKKPSVNIKDEGPRVPAAAVCVVGQDAAFHPHQFRGIRRLRLPREAGPDR